VETSASFEARYAPLSYPTAGGARLTRVPTATVAGESGRPLPLCRFSDSFRALLLFSASSASPRCFFSLSREPHRVEDRGKRLVVIIVGGLRCDADEIDQTLLTQNGHKPIRFLAARR